MPGSGSFAEGLSAAGKRFAIVAARFNGFIVEQLEAGATDALKRHGAKDIKLLRVPGAFELPLAAKALALRQSVDAIVALGCVIRGATPHFEYVSGACINGLGQVSLEMGLPIALGVLTTETVEQAVERANPERENKGFEAAMTAIEMASLLDEIKG